MSRWSCVALGSQGGRRAEQRQPHAARHRIHQGQDLLKESLPEQAYGTNPVVLEATKGKLTDTANSKAVDATVKALKKKPGVTSVVSPLSQKGAAR